jgi:hypothetical protein
MFATADIESVTRLEIIAQGALAQLGERLICIQEVIGSIPIGSTRLHMITKRICGWVWSSCEGRAAQAALTSYREKHQYRLMSPRQGASGVLVAVCVQTATCPKR